MSEFIDPFAPVLNDGDPLSPISAPTMARKQFEHLIRLAHAEGLNVGTWEKCPSFHDTHSRTGCPFYCCDDNPFIVIDTARSWLTVRWQLAVGIGVHQNRHLFQEGGEKGASVWELGRQWANTFLANYAARWVLEEKKLEDNRIQFARARYKVRSVMREASSPRADWDRSERKEKRRATLAERCKAVKSDGKPCRGWRKPGTPFCRHHQHTELSTLNDILAGQKNVDG